MLDNDRKDLGRTERYCVMFMVMIGFLSILDHSWAYYSLARATAIPAELNAFGYQRALSQRATLLAFQARESGDKAVRDEMRATIDELSRSLRDNTAVGQLGAIAYQSPEMLDAVQAAQSEVAEYFHGLRRASEDDRLPLPSAEEAGRVLTVLDTVVKIAEKDAAELVTDARWAGLGFSVGTLAMLTLLGYFLLVRYLRADRRAFARIYALSNRMLAIYEDSPLIQYGLDNQNRIVRVNRAWEQAFNCSRDEAVGRSIMRFSADSSPDKTDTDVTMNAALDTHNEGGALVTYCRSDGSELVGEVHLDRCNEEHEIAGGVNVIVIDKTEVLDKSKQLDELGALSADRFENSPLAQFVATHDGRITKSNTNLLQMMGVQDLHELNRLDSENLNHLIAATAKRRTPDGPVHLHGNKHTLFTASDAALDVLLYLRPRQSNSSGETVLEGALVDVTALEQTRRKIRLSRERFRSLYDETPVMLCSIAPTGKVLDVNEFMCRQLNVHRDDLLDCRFHRLLPDAEERAFLDSHWPRLVVGQAVRFETVIGLSVSRQYPVKIYTRPVFQGGKRLKFIQMTILDTSDVIEAERERDLIADRLQTAEKLEAVGQLAAGIAHEINTPCQYVSDNLGFLAQAVDDILPALTVPPDASDGERPTVDVDLYAEELPQAIQQSVEGMEQIKSIVRAMKDFSHPGAEQKEPIDLNHAIESIVTVSKNEWKYCAEVNLDLDPEVGEVVCSGSSINQVILNLIVNAAHAIESKYGEAGTGRIDVKTRRTDAGVEISVKDDGCGIPKQVLSSVFNPFFTTKEVGKGTGQGLAIVHRIVAEEHDGTLDVNSEDGQGTCFIIRLPDIPLKEVA